MSLSFSHAHNQGSGTTEVVAVLIAITDKKARVLTVDNGKLLPNGPLTPLHRSLQAGVRQWVEAQTGQPLGYIEQLYTFVDTNRRNKEGHALVYVSYMGLVQESDIRRIDKEDLADDFNNNYDALSDSIDHTIQVNSTDNTAQWRDWYDYFPWENRLNIDKDKMRNTQRVIPTGNNQETVCSNTQLIVSHLIKWSLNADSKHEQMRRLQRICLCWGGDWENNYLINASKGDRLLTHWPTDQFVESGLDHNSEGKNGFDKRELVSVQDRFSEWVSEHALLRYEMLYEAGLLPESPDYQPANLPKDWQDLIGEPMYYDHRRVIATAISRLRAKIEYRPLIFGLMPPEFTLLQLQQSVEALSGVRLHKQNFRRLLESQELLEPTGNSSQTGRGRPAKLYRFRFDVELQSLLMDNKLPKRQ